jgi:polysaccharide biosynthesis/export protein
MDTLSGRSVQSVAQPAGILGKVVFRTENTVRGRLLTSSSLRGALAVATVSLIAACTDTSHMPPAPAQPDPGAGYVSSLTPYKLQVGDVLDIRLMLNPELNEEVAVRPDGHISTTVVPDELAYGRTVPELTAALRQDYSHDLRNPRVSVVVKSFAPTRIYVAGEVNNPGEFITVGPTLTLSQAIARAGSYKVRGDTHSVFIIRRGPGDVPQFFSTRFSDIVAGKDPSADVRLAPYDLVYVPKTGIAEVYDYFNQYFQQFVPVSWGFSYVVGAGAGTTVIPTATGH